MLQLFSSSKKVYTPWLRRQCPLRIRNKLSAIVTINVKLDSIYTPFNSLNIFSNCGSEGFGNFKSTTRPFLSNNINRGIELQVTDRELLETTGGIVQGMSGSPILQDGKIIGAVTHVLVQDPTRGFGIFIENMLLQ